MTVRYEPAREVKRVGPDFCVPRGVGWVRTRRLLFATGVRDILPAVAGLRERWGNDVYHCCDGWA